MEICCKCKTFIKNGRFWNKKERGMRKDFKILDKNRSFQKNVANNVTKLQENHGKMLQIRSKNEGKMLQQALKYFGKMLI